MKIYVIIKEKIFQESKNALFRGKNGGMEAILKAFLV